MQVQPLHALAAKASKALGRFLESLAPKRSPETLAHLNRATRRRLEQARARANFRTLRAEMFPGVPRGKRSSRAGTRAALRDFVFRA